MLNKIIKFINYWYFRYLLVTELYMVEKWERVMIHTVFFLILSLVYLFNSTVMIGLSSWLLKSINENLIQGNPLPTSEIPSRAEF